MSEKGGPVRAWIVLVAAGAALAGGLLAWQVARRPSVPFLPAQAPAHWIVYPRPGDTWPHSVVELDGTFSKGFRVDVRPATATLRVRGFRKVLVQVNGREVPLSPDPGNWKLARHADVAPLLVAGENRIEAVVSNDAGPPALWLALELPGSEIVSDRTWESSWAGATTLPAALASEAMDGHRVDSLRLVPPPLQALATRWSTLLAFALASAALVALLAIARRRRGGYSFWSPDSPWPLRASAAALSVAWAVLILNNAPALPVTAGFDARGHLDYVQYLLSRHAIPLADEGWQMFQPPLYYLLAALAFLASGTPTGGLGAVWVIRGLGLATGVATIWLTASALRRIVPGRPASQVAGLVVGGLLPAMLYMHQFVGNEPLVAMLSTAALLLAVHRLQEERPDLAGYAALGILLGLALLAKFSALLVWIAVLGTLVARALAGQVAWRARRLAGAGLAGGVGLLTCGWHFARVWWRLGSPFVGGWDARRGFGWWQDPGYRTAGDFLRVGRVFTAPIYSGFNGFWDGLYATLWGDGLLSGRGDVHLTPHWWSLAPMSAGYLLALVPLLLVLLGLGRTVVAWARRPSGTDALLLGLSGLLLVAIAYMTIEVPSVVSDKASYGLMGLLPMCVFAARGAGMVTGGSRGRALGLAALLGTWGINSLSTFWVSRGSTDVQLIRANDLLAEGDTRGAVAMYYDVLRRDPDDWRARLPVAVIMIDNDAPRREVTAMLGGRNPPENEWRHFLLSRLAEKDRDLPRALAEARQAVALDPDQPDDRARLASLLAAAGMPGEAIREWREVLRIDPQDREAHRALATLLQQQDLDEQARHHRDRANRLQPRR